MSSIRTAATLVILAVIITGISMANKPNEGTDTSITVSPSTLMLSRDIRCVTIHSNIEGFVPKELLLLEGIADTDPIQPYETFTDARNHLVAKFSGIDIRTIVAPGNKVELTLLGPGIEASDTIRVKK